MSDLIAAAGPFQGVQYNLHAPYEDATKTAQLAWNGYFVNTQGAKSWQARPGFVQYGPIAAVGKRTQGAVAFADPTSGTIYRFFAVDGKLFRASSTFGAFTDVTPGGIAISNATSTRVSFVPMGSSCVVTDGVNRPWVMTNFGGSPVTGAYIDIDGAAGAWSSWGKPTVYQGSVFFIAQTVPGGSAVLPRVGIVWCEPNQPTVGYTQTGYANYWNIIENGSEPLYAILGTNNGLFYWRESSIGLASGTPSINFSTTATRDYRGDPVGTVCPWAVALFENNIFFLDNSGRPWMMPVDGNPQPIWQQLTTSLDGDNTPPGPLSFLATGTIVPELNQYIVAMSTTDYTTSVSPSGPYIFDASNGSFGGRWAIGSSVPGSGIDLLETMLDANGRRALCVCGGAVALDSGSYVRLLRPIDDGVFGDAGGGPQLLFYTKRLGYTANRLLYPDYVVIVVDSPETMVVVHATTAQGTSQIIGSVVPVGNTLIGGEYRAVVGLNGLASRWVLIDIYGPQSPTFQWGVQRIEVYGTTGPAGPEDA